MLLEFQWAQHSRRFPRSLLLALAEHGRQRDRDVLVGLRLPDRRDGQPHHPGGQQHVEQLPHRPGGQGHVLQRVQGLRDHDRAERGLRPRHLRGRHGVLRGRHQQVLVDGPDRRG